MEGKARVATSEATLAACGTGRRRDGPRTRRTADANRSSQAARGRHAAAWPLRRCCAWELSSTRGPLVLRELSAAADGDEDEERLRIVGRARDARTGDRSTSLKRREGCSGGTYDSARLGAAVRWRSADTGLSCGSAVAVNRRSNGPQSPAQPGGGRSVSQGCCRMPFMLRVVHCMLDGFCCLLLAERYVCFMHFYVGRQVRVWKCHGV
jgi:hypothetical protein